MVRHGFLVACFLAVPAALLAQSPPSSIPLSEWVRQARSQGPDANTYSVTLKNGVLIIQDENWQGIGHHTKSGWYAVKWTSQQKRAWEDDTSKVLDGMYYVQKDVIDGFHFVAVGKIYEKYTRQKPREKVRPRPHEGK